MRQSHSRWKVLAFVVSLALVAAACGGDDDDESDSKGSGTGGGDTTEAAVDTTGVLQIGGDLTAAAALQFDPVSVDVVMTTVHEYLYGTLLRLTPEGKIEPDLAKAATVVDPSNLKVELRPNLKFSDGTVLDAAALKASWERNLAKAKPGGLEAEFRQIETMTVSAPLVLDVKLKLPVAGAFYRLLRLGETSPYSIAAANAPGGLDKNPVGAGPFTLTSATPSVAIEFKKNPGYWNAKKIKLGGIKISNVTSQSLTNALRSNTIDMASVLAVTQANELKGLPQLNVTVKPSTSSTLVALMCKSRPPFDDVKVRQALNYALDRDALNKQVYDGLGEPAWGFNGKNSPFFDKSLDGFYKYDVEKAKKLLAEAGKTDLAFEAAFNPGTDSQTSAEVIQQQWAKAGIKVSLKPLTNPTDFFPDAKGVPMYIFPLARVGIAKVTRTLQPGSFGNVCNWNDPELNASVLKLQGVSETSPEGVAAWKAVSKRALDTGAWVFGLFTTEASSYNKDRLADVQYYESRLGTPSPDLWSIYVKKK